LPRCGQPDCLCNLYVAVSSGFCSESFGEASALIEATCAEVREVGHQVPILQHVD